VRSSKLSTKWQVFHTDLGCVLNLYGMLLRQEGFMDMHQIFSSMRTRLFTVIERRSRRTILAWSLGLIAVIGVIDYATGNYSLIIFYMVPIFVAAWFVSSTAGLAVSVCSFISSIVTNPGRDVQVSTFYWDVFLELVYLVLFSLMFSSLRAQFNLECEMSRVDPLTNAMNRRALCEVADYEISRSSHAFHPMSMAFIDLDNFKAVNDRMGHAEGDKVLKEVVTTMRGVLRKADTIARVGGDEFVVMLPETGEESAGVVLQKLREDLLGSMTRNGWPVTFSIGLITHETTPESAEDMISQADQLMYSIKNSNKNAILHRVITDKTSHLA
jgi:diguanylate cyclase (GGDEF)-like protein